MALRAVIDHPKFSMLKSILGKNKAETLGYLEALWHFCGRYTPAGNIGKYSDAQIEAWLEWRGNEGDLIQAYVISEWLDEDDTYRLVVHDWHEHCDDATRLALKRKDLSFVTTMSRHRLDTVPTPSRHCPDTVVTDDDNVPTPSRLPVPVPVPVPEPVPDIIETSSHKIKKTKSSQYSQAELETQYKEFVDNFPMRNGARGIRPGLLKFVSLVNVTGFKPDDIIEGVKRYKAWSIETNHEGTEFIKQIPTWLNQHCWLEDWQTTQNTERSFQEICKAKGLQ